MHYRARNFSVLWTMTSHASVAGSVDRASALLSEEGQVAMLVLCAFGSDGAGVHDDSVAGCSRA